MFKRKEPYILRCPACDGVRLIPNDVSLSRKPDRLPQIQAMNGLITCGNEECGLQIPYNWFVNDQLGRSQHSTLRSMFKWNYVQKGSGG